MNDYYETSWTKDRGGPEHGLTRVVRGGSSWSEAPNDLRSAKRKDLFAVAREAGLGFRVVLPVPSAE